MTRAMVRVLVLGCAVTLASTLTAAVAAGAEDAPPTMKAPAAVVQPAAAPAPPPAAKPAPPVVVAPAPAATPAPVVAAPPPASPAPGAIGVPPPSIAAPADPALMVPTVPVPAKPKKVVRAAPPSEYALPSEPTPSFQPDTFYTTAKASERYSAIADAGGWPVLPVGVRLGPKSKGAAVATLRLRLSIEGDFSGATDETAWEPALTAAVKHYQERVGLKQTGIVAGATLKALNVPASVRFRQLASSSQRLAGVTFPFEDRYVVVNIPSTSVEAVENGSVVKRYVAIVGDVDHPSPEVQAKVAAVNLNPTWTVPISIIKNEIIPKMRKDPGYLTRQKIRILDGKGNTIDPSKVDWSGDKAANYTLRQDSGAGNSLGSIRINMPNKFAVYMHDTPSKRLFGADYRFLSHGCVRVSGVYNLAEWLLQGTDGNWTVPAMQAAIATTEHKEIRLAKPVPVIWVYLTGWASADGTVHFRDDVYGIDSVGTDTQAQAEPR